MTERKMTPKGFLSKLSSAKSAIGFLAAHREYLTTGELATLTSPIVRMVDERQLMPTPALAEIQAVVFRHVMEADLRKAEKSLVPSIGNKEPKAFIATIRDAEGRVQWAKTESGEDIELSKEFDMPQDAERWCDRKLFDGAPDWHGEILWTKCPEKLADFKVRQVAREDSMARILRQPGSMATRTVKVGGNGLGFGVKVRNDVSKFSHG